MLSLGSTLLLAVGVFSAQATTLPRTTNDARMLLSVNDVLDGVLTQMRKVIVNQGYDPMPLPDYEASFLHIGLLGKLELTNCNLHKLSTVYRSQDVSYGRDGLTFNVQTAVAFEHLKVNCTYVASILGVLRKKGEVVVSLPNLSAEVNLDLMVGKLTAVLNDLRLVNKGPIDVHLEGGLIDALASILTQTISNLFKNVILNQVENMLEDELREILGGGKGEPSYVEMVKTYPCILSQSAEVIDIIEEASQT